MKINLFNKLCRHKTTLKSIYFKITRVFTYKHTNKKSQVQ